MVETVLAAVSLRKWSPGSIDEASV
ncbi:uncharacterized protein METZ01_LOCUS183853, partial [marine metagenome]